jgi:hypothetical protein
MVLQRNGEITQEYKQLMKGINDMSDDQPHKKTCWCEYAGCIPVATTSRIVGETTHGNITDVTPFFPTLKMAQDALAKPATTEFIPAEDADWLHKFYAKGTPIEFTGTTKQVTPETFGFYQQEHKWFSHHPEDMYDDFVQPDIHINPATIINIPVEPVEIERE